MRSTKKKDDGFSSKFPSEESLQAYRNYQSGFVKENYRSFMFRAKKLSEKKLVDYCENQENFSAFISQLIKTDMVAHNVMPDDYDNWLDANILDKDAPFVFKNDAKVDLFANIEYQVKDNMPSMDWVNPTSAELLEDLALREHGIEIVEVSATKTVLSVTVKYPVERSLKSVANYLAFSITERVKAEYQIVRDAFISENCIFEKYDATPVVG